MILPALLLLLADPTGFGGPLPDPRDEVSAADRTRIDKAISMDRASSGVSISADSDIVYPFFPMAGTLGQELYFNNTVDLDATAGIRDFECTGQTYDGHRGHDVDLISFRQQEIGVPVFAAMDGTVVDAHDGEPDMNTAMSNARANYVVLRHAGTHYTLYYHLKRGSVTVVKDQTVTAGTQLGLTASSGSSTGPHLHFETQLAGATVEPSAGPCRPGRSYWSRQPAIRRDPYLRDFAFSSDRFDRYAEWPYDDAPRVGSYVQGNRTIHFKIILQNLPAQSSYRLRIIRPSGAVAAEYTNSFNNSSAYRHSWWWWFWTLDFQPAGLWSVEIAVNGSRVVLAPFLVVSQPAGSIPPRRVDVTLEPLPLSENDVAFCRTSASFPDDMDYEIVRYRYQWDVGGRIVREVTAAAKSDALAKGFLRRGDTVTCTVTPSDGTLNGTSTAAQATVSGPVVASRRRAVRR